MIKEAVYRSPKWLRKYVDFEVSTGEDISDKISIRNQEKEPWRRWLKKKWNKRWLECDESKFKDFFKEVYDDYTNNNLRGHVVSSDLKTIKSDFEGDMELWDKFDKWIKEKKEKEQRQNEIKKELDDLKERLISDFGNAPYDDKFETPTINGKVCFHYTFENGDTFKICDDQIQYSNGSYITTYTVGLIYRNEFISLANSIVNKARRRSSSSSSKKSKSSDPKRVRYDEIIDKIRLREDHIRKMSSSDPNKEQLKNELDNYKRAAQRMKDKYKFEHLTGFENYEQFNESNNSDYEMIVDIFSDLQDLEEVRIFDIKEFKDKVKIVHGTYQRVKNYGFVRPSDIKISLEPLLGGFSGDMDRDAKLSDKFFDRIMNCIEGVQKMTDYSIFGIWIDYSGGTTKIYKSDFEDITKLDPKRLRNLRIILRKNLN
jgi:hypothetical protein